MSQVQIMIVEDEVLICDDLRAVLTNIDYNVIAVAHNGEDALDKLTRYLPDLVLLDINLKGGLDGIQVGKTINELYDIPFVYLTSYASRGVLDRAKSTHPLGYVVKPFTEKEIFATLEIALYNYHNQTERKLNMESINGHLKTPLTPREFQMLRSIHSGKTNSQIAEDHFLSVNTIKTHIRTLYEKLNVHTRTEALVRIREIGEI